MSCLQKKLLLWAALAQCSARGGRSSHIKLIRSLHSGFTIVELIVYMGLLSVFLLSITWVVAALSETQLDSVATSDVDMTATQLFSRFENDIALAESVSVPLTLGVSSDELRLMINSQENRYFVQDGVLWLAAAGITERLSPVQIIISDFSTLRLGNVGGVPTVTVSFELQSSIIENAGFEVRQMQYTIGKR